MDLENWPHFLHVHHNSSTFHRPRISKIYVIVRDNLIDNTSTMIFMSMYSNDICQTNNDYLLYRI